MNYGRMRLCPKNKPQDSLFECAFDFISALLWLLTFLCFDI